MKVKQDDSKNRHFLSIKKHFKYFKSLKGQDKYGLEVIEKVLILFDFAYILYKLQEGALESPAERPTAMLKKAFRGVYEDPNNELKRKMQAVKLLVLRKAMKTTSHGNAGTF